MLRFNILKSVFVCSCNILAQCRYNSDHRYTLLQDNVLITSHFCPLSVCTPPSLHAPSLYLSLAHPVFGVRADIVFHHQAAHTALPAWQVENWRWEWVQFLETVLHSVALCWIDRDIIALLRPRIHKEQLYGYKKKKTSSGNHLIFVHIDQMLTQNKKHTKEHQPKYVNMGND